MIVADTYTSREVSAMTGATYRQLDYWCRTGRIPGHPFGSPVGSGHRREWTATQIERVRLLQRASRLVNASLDEAVQMLIEGSVCREPDDLAG